MKAREVVTAFLERLPEVMDLIAADVGAAYEGDPAATCLEEMILAYPGVKAVFTYRIATPAAQARGAAGPADHDRVRPQRDRRRHPPRRRPSAGSSSSTTAPVWSIGETTVIGDRVKLYQGVTLGALSFPRDGEGRWCAAPSATRPSRTTSSSTPGATILGGDTVVGRGSVIGGNVWLTTSVPPDSRVTLSRDQLALRDHVAFEPEGAR